MSPIWWNPELKAWRDLLLRLERLAARPRPTLRGYVR